MKSVFKKPIFLAVYVLIVLIIYSQVAYLFNGKLKVFASFDWVSFIIGSLLFGVVILSIIRHRFFRMALLYFSVLFFLYALLEIGLDIALIVNKGTIPGLNFLIFFCYVFESIMLFIIAKSGIKIVNKKPEELEEVAEK